MDVCRNTSTSLHEFLDNVLTSNWFLIAGFALVLSVGLMTRLALLDQATYPGHGDYAFYYTVAENIVDGEGLQIDYVWTYLSKPETIIHTSHDFWMPLTSIIISLSMLIFGKSLHAALMPSITTGLLLPVVVYFLAKKLTESRLVAFCSASLVLFMPYLFSRSLLTDSPIYYALFVNSALFCIAKGQEKQKWYLLAAVFTGLSHLTRQDGILLFIVLELVIMVSSLGWRKKIAYVFIASGIYILVLSPLLISNFKIFGSPFPPGPSKSMFITDYEDQYTYAKALTLENYLNWGATNIVKSKIAGVIGNVHVVYNNFLSTFLKAFVAVGVLILFSPLDKRRIRNYFPSYLFFFFLFTFYALVIPVSSGTAGFIRSGMALIPLFVIIAVDTICRVVPSKPLAILLLLLIITSSMNRSIQFTRSELGENTRIGLEINKLNQVLIEKIPQEQQGEIVIMTRNPWEVYHTTRHPAIQIPNDDIDTIYEVAQKFRANYLLLPAHRTALEDIYTGRERDERFILIAEVPNSDMKLFEIKLSQ